MTTIEETAESRDPIDILFHSLRDRRSRLRALLGAWKQVEAVLPVRFPEADAVRVIKSKLVAIDTVLSNEDEYRHIDRKEN